MKINVALFGLGRIGMMHANNIHKDSNFKLEKIINTDKAKIKVRKPFWS